MSARPAPAGQRLLRGAALGPAVRRLLHGAAPDPAAPTVAHRDKSPAGANPRPVPAVTGRAEPRALRTTTPALRAVTP